MTGIEVNPELTSAVVFYSSLGGAEADPVVLEALGERRVRLQGAIARQARLIGLNAVHSAAMPPGNITRMTREEREILAAGVSAVGAFR